MTRNSPHVHLGSTKTCCPVCFFFSTSGSSLYSLQWKQTSLVVCHVACPQILDHCHHSLPLTSCFFQLIFPWPGFKQLTHLLSNFALLGVNLSNSLSNCHGQNRLGDITRKKIRPPEDWMELLPVHLKEVPWLKWSSHLSHSLGNVHPSPKGVPFLLLF